MPLTREMAVEVGVKAREALSRVYGPRLKGVYLFGSAARGEATAALLTRGIERAQAFVEMCRRFCDREV